MTVFDSVVYSIMLLASLVNTHSTYFSGEFLFQAGEWEFMRQ